MSGIAFLGGVRAAPAAALAQRQELKRTGIYMLVGPDTDTPTKDLVYIGEGDNVLTRLTRHESDEAKDFWTRTVVVTSKDENLTKAHVRYLESRLVQIATQASRATLSNGTAPPLPALPEPDVANMEYFLGQVQLVLPVLGFSFTQPRPATAVVFGGNQRGPLVWRTEDGSRTYRDWQEEKLKQAGVKLAGG